MADWLQTHFFKFNWGDGDDQLVDAGDSQFRVILSGVHLRVEQVGGRKPCYGPFLVGLPRDYSRVGEYNSSRDSNFSTEVERTYICAGTAANGYCECNLLLIYAYSPKPPTEAGNSIDITNDNATNTASLALEDFGKLLESGDSSDVTIKVKGHPLAAHKAILGARSPVFKAMFTHDTLENQTNEVNIEECDVEVFKQLLLYFYTGSCGPEIEQPLQLYLLADKYLMDGLKDICQDAFYDQLTPENVRQMNAEAMVAGASALQDEAYRFICDNASQVRSIVDKKC